VINNICESLVDLDIVRVFVLSEGLDGTVEPHLNIDLYAKSK